MKHLATLLALLHLLAATVTAGDWVVYEGTKGPGKGKHIVLLAGDDEYRSEEGLPQLGKILAVRHGFKCTVLFSVTKEGNIGPDYHHNQPGLEALGSADLCIMLLRFRQWPDEQMKHFVDYYLAGKPIVALRTSTHAFNYDKDSTSAYKKFGWQSQDWPGGFGKQLLGETWVSHWGHHKKEAALGIIPEAAKKHPILRGITEIFGDSDVYEAAPPADAQVLVLGQVLKGMTPTDAPADYRKETAKGVEQGVNDPMMPVAWLRDYRNEAGRVNRIFNTTLGAATDLLSEGTRRLVVNASYWAVGLEKQIPRKSNVDYVGDFKPTMYGFGTFKKGVKPAEYEMNPAK